MFPLMSQKPLKRTQNPFKHLRWSIFAQTVNTLKSLTGYAKKNPSWMFEGVLNMPLLEDKAVVSCTKTTLDAAT